MKRMVVFVSLLAGLVGSFPFSGVSAALPRGGTFGALAPTCEVVSDLPWGTVSAVLERVSDVRPYSYAELVDWYQVGLVTVEALGSGYRVTVADEDGIVEVLVIDGI